MQASSIKYQARFARTMGGNVFMLICILILCMCPSVLGVIKSGILHETITLPCSQSCNGLMTWTLEDTGLAIKCTNRSCETGTGFENRFSISNECFDGKRSCGLTISSLKYNDQGIYSGYCDGRYYGAVTLDVLVPDDVYVLTGNNVTLLCHAAIEKNTNEMDVSIFWEKYGGEKWEEVLRLEKGNFTYGRMKGRVSVPEDGYKSGELHLRIKDARPSDEGVYRCRYSSTRDAGVPNSVRLNVKDGETLPQPQPRPGRDFLFFVSGVIVCGVVVCVIVLWNKFQCRCTNGASPPTPEQGGAANSEKAAPENQETEAPQPMHAGIAPPVSELDDCPLSTPLTETNSHSSYPWADKPICKDFL